MFEAAETLEDCAMRSKKEAYDLAKQTKVSQLLTSNEKRRSKQIKEDMDFSEEVISILTPKNVNLLIFCLLNVSEKFETVKV